eukprot:scaffold25019_cov69-Phaeocystis_antarctica.AAC.1
MVAASAAYGRSHYYTGLQPARPEEGVRGGERAWRRAWLVAHVARLEGVQARCRIGAVAGLEQEARVDDLRRPGVAQPSHLLRVERA